MRHSNDILLVHMDLTLKNKMQKNISVTLLYKECVKEG